jgi:hypothetical protein
VMREDRAAPLQRVFRELADLPDRNEAVTCKQGRGGDLNGDVGMNEICC